MCADPLVTMFAIIGVVIVGMELLSLGCDGIIAALDWWCEPDHDNDNAEMRPAEAK